MEEEKKEKSYEVLVDEFCLERNISVDRSGWQKIKALGEDYFRLFYAKLLEFIQTNSIDQGIKIGDIFVYVKKENKEEKKLLLDQSRMILGENYEKIISVFDDYMDMDEDQKVIAALYAIATYFMKEFETFPILYVNATKGSGKTRFDKIMKHICWNGELVTSLKESSLFRNAGKGTLIIDEFEHLGAKGADNLNDLLNTCYKRGLKVPRMRKIKTVIGEDWVCDNFETFCPVIISNIWGMQETLGDRCIPIVLEKSDNPRIVRKVENFSKDLVIQQIKANFSLSLVQLCSFFGQGDIYREWNSWINDKYTTYTTYTTLDTLTTLTTQLRLHLEEMFLSIDKLSIGGRDLELLFPLILVSWVLGDSVFETMLNISRRLIESRKVEELTESKDMLLIQFVATKLSISNGTWIGIKNLSNQFRNYLGMEVGDEEWVNPKWIGRAFKRLNLALEKRRASDGIEVILNIQKAKEKIKGLEKL